MENSKLVQTLGAAVIGAATGLVCGVLFAPRSGAKSRKLLSKLSQDTLAKSQKTVDELAELGLSSINQVKQKVFHN